MTMIPRMLLIPLLLIPAASGALVLVPGPKPAATVAVDTKPCFASSSIDLGKLQCDEERTGSISLTNSAACDWHIVGLNSTCECLDVFQPASVLPTRGQISIGYRFVIHDPLARGRSRPCITVTVRNAAGESHELTCHFDVEVAQ
jgi:hypothetical protein